MPPLSLNLVSPLLTMPSTFPLALISASASPPPSDLKFLLTETTKKSVILVKDLDRFMELGIATRFSHRESRA